MTETTKQAIRDNVRRLKTNRYEMRYQWIWEQRRYEDETPTHSEYFDAKDDQDAVSQMREWIEEQADDVEIECLQQVREVDMLNPIKTDSHKISDRNILIKELRKNGLMLYNLLAENDLLKQLPVDVISFWELQAEKLTERRRS